MTEARSGQEGIFLLGMPRSGTTWLGHIFDSHPQTILRHEPDTIHTTTRFPFVPVDELDDGECQEAARRYLSARLSDRELRCVGSGHSFNKHYRSPLLDGLRRGLVFSGRGLDALLLGRIERKLKIPDLCSSGERPVPVVKSVDSAARTPLFARACPQHRFFYIVRHPCGVVASKLRGTLLGKLPRARAYSQWLKFPLAIEAGLTQAQMDAWNQLEIAAWGWTLTNDFVLRSSIGQENLRVINYDTLCESPGEMVRELFDSAALTWQEQTERYIASCLATDSSRDSQYYSTLQNPRAAASKWVSELSEKEITAVMGISASSAFCRDFVRTGGTAGHHFVSHA